jgi:two-component system, LuxR family, sensor kinase FixL
MNWVDAVWIAAMAACGTLAVLQFLVWKGNRAAWASLAFSGLAVSVIGIGACELALMRAATPEAYVTIERWIHVPIFATVVLIVVFVHFYFGTGRLWLGHAAWVTRLASLVINFASTGNVTHSAVTGLDHVEILGQQVAVAVGPVTPWAWLPRGSILLLLAFIADSAVGSWRRGGADGRRRAASVGATMFLFLFASVVHVGLVTAGVVRTPYLITIFFLGAAGAMGAELSREVIGAAELGRRLKERERELDESGGRLRAIVDAAMDAIITVDERRRVVQFNSAAEAMFRCRASDVLGEPIDQLVPAHLPGRHGAHLDKSYGSGVTAKSFSNPRITGLRADGEEFPLEASVSQVVVDGRELQTAILRDCTALQRAEVEVQSRRAELAHLSRVSLLSELSGSIAHELNQPLGAILANAEAVRRLLDRQDPDLGEIREVIQDIIADDRRAGEVIRRIRQLVKKGALQAEVLDLPDLVREVLELLHGELSMRTVSAHTEFDDAAARVLADRVELQQVLLNLVMNAAEAMAAPDWKPRIVTVHTRRTDKGIASVSVSDTGPGITKVDVGDIFKPFVTTKPHGMGMGLSICQTIVEANGGRLWAESNGEGGATFHFTVPLAE